jgi:hypothetical protein
MAATTWDSITKAAGITLSGGSLVATAASGTNPGCFATRTLTGPSYWEVASTVIASTMGIGFANRLWNDASGTLLGGDANGLAYRNDGTVRLNNVTLATIAAYVAGNSIGTAVNPQARLCWFRVGAGGWNNDVIGNQNPVGNVGGIDFSSMGFGTLLPAFGASTTTGAGTAIFTSGFANAAPSGYITVDTCGALGVAAELTSSAAQHDGPARQDPVTTHEQKSIYLGGYGPLAGTLNIAGVVQENSANVAKRVLVFDRNGEKIGEATSNASTGVYSIPGKGRSKVFVVALDDPTYNALLFDEVIPA